jgi:radical SAM superfamily enzyme YgiQ (UPF0313 family)
MNILLVYPEFPETFWSFKYALSFVHKKASSPPLGLATVASLLPAEWDKRLVDMNVEALKDSDLQWADYVFISAMTIQRESAKEVIGRCNKLSKKIVAGGPLFTAEYQLFSGIDYYVLNEGELTIPPFLEDLARGEPKPLYKTDDYADIKKTPIPMWELIKLDKYDSLSIQYSRGCPFNCDFCYVTALLGHNPRTKSAQQIIAELDKMYEMGWRRNIFFVDDNFIGNKREIKEEILPALIEWRKGKAGINFITETSINLADDEELMDLMVEAGFVSVFVGIETPAEEGLTECHKSQNKNRNLIESVKQLQRKGLQVMAGFIVGFDSDTETIFKRQIDFIQNSGIVTAMVGLLQAPFGTKLYDRMAEEGRIIDEFSGDNVDGSSNIRPVMNADLLQNGYHEILSKIYSPDFFYQRVKTFLMEYKPPQTTVHIEFQEVMALFRSIFRLGITGKEWSNYWNLIFWTLFHCPDKFPLAITFSIYGFHFRKVSELHGLA